LTHRMVRSLSPSASARGPSPDCKITEGTMANSFFGTLSPFRSSNRRQSCFRFGPTKRMWKSTPVCFRGSRHVCLSHNRSRRGRTIVTSRISRKRQVREIIKLSASEMSEEKPFIAARCRHFLIYSGCGKSFRLSPPLRTNLPCELKMYQYAGLLL
jgi:hypothetical protein